MSRVLNVCVSLYFTVIGTDPENFQGGWLLMLYIYYVQEKIGEKIVLNYMYTVAFWKLISFDYCSLITTLVSVCVDG